MDEPKSCKVFGPYLAHLGVIEFQQRGYPHALLVYTFKSEGPQHLNEMDKWVWARILDESIANGLLREKVCLLYTSPSPRDGLLSRMPSSA